MTKLVILKATYAHFDSYLHQRPSGVKAEYWDGSELTKKDSAKLDKITSWYLDTNRYPVFVLNNDPDFRPLTAEACIDLDGWTKEGKPRFRMRDLSQKTF